MITYSNKIHNNNLYIQRLLMVWQKMYYQDIMEQYSHMDRLDVVKHTLWLEELMWRSYKELFPDRLGIFYPQLVILRINSS